MKKFRAFYQQGVQPIRVDATSEQAAREIVERVFGYCGEVYEVFGDSPAAFVEVQSWQHFQKKSDH